MPDPTDTETLAEVLADTLAPHEVNLRLLWRDLAREGIELGTDWPFIARTLFGDMDALAARIVQARAGEGALREVLEALTDPAEMERAMYRHSGMNEDLLPLAAVPAAAVLRAALTTADPGLPGYFVHPDGFGAPVIWQGTGPDDPTCRLVLEGWRVQAVAPDLWAAIAALVEGKP